MCDMGRHGEHVNELIPNNIQSEIFADVGRLMNNQTSGSVSFSFLFKGADKCSGDALHPCRLESLW